MRALGLLACALAMAACSTGPKTEIQGGRYSGSTAKDVALTIDIGGSQVRVNNRKARLERVDDNRKFVADRLPGKPKFSCSPQASGRELRCDVTWPDHTEVIELMKE